ncbi:WG repeat-containing protein [Fulvivirgaceae bacterium BMA12]|uniref:WG repeat-containing protein n=1 Tax=Agaribacillus aureus TaxID=3051825 RepID=A0ABT8L3Q4_9BACT|nr:WG repeat-containing protein [Fulvivirgaceae bacterium BMA12]
MRRSSLVLVLIFFSLFEGVFAQNSKRALNLLEKKDYLKAEQTFKKAIEKDSINPGAYYVHSLLYLTDSFPRYSLDSSYLLILKALDHYTIADPKEIERLNKIEISDITLQSQKRKIDSLAFQQSVSVNKEAYYNLFLEKHATALQVAEAKILRNKVAYQEAKDINTYQSYKKFMDKYPEALEFRKAEDNYNQLLFAEKTKDGSLRHYQQFLSDFPQTPYRTIIEKHIFEMITADNEKTSYEDFIQQYPKSKWIKKALDYLYYHYQKGGMSDDFLTKFSNIPSTDSIKNAVSIHESMLFPILENQQYKFIDQTGKLWDKLVLDSDIEESYYCEGVKEDFMMVGYPSHKAIITKTGKKIYEGRFETAEPIGFGFLKITNRKKCGVIHRSGWEVLPMEWDDITLISDQYLAVEKNGLLGLCTLSGRVLFTPQFQDVTGDGDYYMFTKEDKIAITNKHMLTALLEANNFHLDHVYDDYQVVNQHYIIGIRGAEECLINSKLEVVIPMSQQKIYDRSGGWYVVKPDTFLSYNDQLKPTFTAPYDKYQLNDGRVALKKDQRWALFNFVQATDTDFAFDSLQFLSKNITYLVKDGEGLIYLSNGQEIKIKENQSFQLIHANAGNNLPDSSEYVLVFDTKKRTTTVYNARGDKIKGLTNTQINSLYGSHFIIEKNGKKGIMNKDGKTLLPAYYDAIGKPKNGTYSLLRSNKFGLFDPTREFTIRPSYQSALSGYNKSLLIANKSDKKGLIDLENKAQTPFIFEKINFWNDSLALVYKDNYWGIYDIYDNEYRIENIISLQLTGDTLETKAIVLGEKGYGVLSNKSGMIISPTFDDLQIIGGDDVYLYFCEKYVKEADLYVVVYYDKTGKRIWRQVYDSNVYDRIYCDN